VFVNHIVLLYTRAENKRNYQLVHGVCFDHLYHVCKRGSLLFDEKSWY